MKSHAIFWFVVWLFNAIAYVGSFYVLLIANVICIYLIMCLWVGYFDWYLTHPKRPIK